MIFFFLILNPADQTGTDQSVMKGPLEIIGERKRQNCLRCPAAGGSINTD